MCHPGRICSTCSRCARTSWIVRMSTPDFSTQPDIPFRAAARIPLTLTDAIRIMRSRLSGLGSATALEDGLLHLGDRLGDLDTAGARLGAVEGRAAAPDALGVVEDVEAHLRLVVARIEDEPVRVDDRGGAEVLTVGPEDGAR